MLTEISSKIPWGFLLFKISWRNFRMSFSGDDWKYVFRFFPEISSEAFVRDSSRTSFIDCWITFYRSFFWYCCRNPSIYFSRDSPGILSEIPPKDIPCYFFRNSFGKVLKDSSGNFVSGFFRSSFSYAFSDCCINPFKECFRIFFLFLKFLLGYFRNSLTNFNQYSFCNSCCIHFVTKEYLLKIFK